MYKKLLFCTDGSKNSECAQRTAFKLAKDCGSTLYVLMVTDLTDEFEALAPGLTGRLIDDSKEKVAKVVDAAKSAGISAEGIVKDGEANKKIIETAAEVGAEAIVMGTHGRKGFFNVVMGSVTRLVIAQAPVPVIVVHSKYCVI
ncbi:MAG TPA: universal stress protein [Nitrospirota bacterium]